MDANRGVEFGSEGESFQGHVTGDRGIPDKLGPNRDIESSQLGQASTRYHKYNFDHQAAAARLNALHAERGDFVCDLNSKDPKYYALGMFPYPSGDSHMGHVLVFSITDVRARLAKLEGLNVLNPLGWDAFGLPAENAAIKNKIDPATWTDLNIRRMRDEQFSNMGWSFDATKEISTCDPLYYAQTQRLFLLM